MDSAPKADGEILIYCEKTGEQFVAYWGTCPDDGDQRWTFASGNGVSFIIRDPSHWRRLPEPPNAEAEQVRA